MRRIAFVLVVLASTLPLACATKKQDPTAGAKAGSKGKGGGGLAFAVDVIPVEAKKVAYGVTAPGTIDAFERVQVTARVAGAVDKVSFSEGQQVKKGDVLVVIDSERFQLAVNSAKAALAKAQAAQTDSEAMVSRREGASDQHPGLIPGEELATYRTKSLTAKADTDVAVENLKTAELNLRDSFVKAPMEGIIQSRTVETGQYVQTGYVMATLLRQDPMLLRFQVEPSDAPRLKPGMTASFTLRETQRTFAAKISLVGGAADPTTHMVQVTAELTDKEHKYWLRPGSFCDVSIDLSGERVSPVVPRLAVRATDHGYVTYVIEGDVAKEHVVNLGMNTKDGWVEIRSGLAAGDQLVVRGGEALTNGAKVKITHVSADSIMSNDAGADEPPATADLSASDDGGAPHEKRRGNGGAAPGGSGSAARAGAAGAP